MIALDDDATLPCPLCNSWCTLCLEGVPTFVQITHPYCGSLIAGMRPTDDGEALFEGYACDYHKATLCSYSYIAPPMIGRYEAGQAYLAAQGAHCLVIGTRWEEFRELDLAKLGEVMASRVVVDGRNLLDPASVTGAGLSYYSMGRRPILVEPAAARA